jgi:hypothetical protein
LGFLLFLPTISLPRILLVFIFHVHAPAALPKRKPRPPPPPPPRTHWIGVSVDPRASLDNVEK